MDQEGAMSGKTLYVHIGPGKTGSSALQVFLARHAEALARQGVLYPSWDDSNRRAAAGEITSGNGVVLCRYLGVAHPAGLPEAEIERLVAQGLSDAPSVLLSSELLQSASVEGLHRLQDLAARLGARLRYIYYLRSAFPVYVSIYNQAVKRSGYQGTLEEFVRTRPMSHYQTLRRLVAASGAGAVVLRSYESARADLPSDFMQAIGLPALPEDADAQELVNPSLSAIDTNILRSLNRFLSNAQDSRVLSDWMLENANYMASGFGEIGLSAEACRLIRKRHKNDHDWIAQQFGEERAAEIFLNEKQGGQGPELDGSAAHLARFVGLLADELLQLRRVVHRLSTELRQARDVEKDPS
jgi:hypothetical protein